MENDFNVIDGLDDEVKEALSKEITAVFIIGFILGIIAGFLISPAKKGITIGSNNTCSLDVNVASPSERKKRLGERFDAFRNKFSR